MKKISYIYLGLYILMIIVIFFSSLQNGQESINASSNITNILINISEKIFHIEIDRDAAQHFVRKIIGHFGSFVVCGLFGILFYYSITKKGWIFSLIVGAIISIIAELLQLLSSGRACQVTDMLINFSGICFSTLIVFLIYLIKNKKIIEV